MNIKMARSSCSCHGTRRASALALAASLPCIVMSPDHLQAQSATVPAVVDGIVTDANLAPLASATVSLLGTTMRVVTGSNGRFRMLGLSAGSYVVIAHRLGYTPVTTTQQVAGGDTLRLTFALERNIAQLDTVAVVAVRRSSRLTEFEDRRKTGTGQSMTAAEMEKRNAVVVKDLLRTFTGVTILNDAEAVNRRVGPSRSCPFKFFIDGVSMRTPGLDDLPSLKELAGIEVFASIASVPLQYKSYDGGGFCGVILLWTKDGSEPD